mgnify:CR=1 FL=1
MLKWKFSFCFLLVFGAFISQTVQEYELIIPVDSRVTSASLAENGQILLIVENATGQQIWQVDAAGKVQRKTRVTQSR